MERRCTVCLYLGKDTPARFVASGDETIPGHPMQWFECGEHSDHDHPDFPRKSLEPLEQWLERHGLADYYDAATADALDAVPKMAVPEGYLWDRADRVKTRPQ